MNSMVMVDCPLCGHRYTAQGHGGCESCPMGAGCATLCCPACGYSTIDTSRSILARIGRLFSKPAPAQAPVGLARPAKPAPATVQPSSNRSHTPMTLNEIVSGGHARIAGFAQELPPGQREHLQAYGLVEGRKVRVLQHSPAVVVRIEHLELALEAELAGQVEVVGEPGEVLGKAKKKARR